MDCLTADRFFIKWKLKSFDEFLKKPRTTYVMILKAFKWKKINDRFSREYLEICNGQLAYGANLRSVAWPFYCCINKCTYMKHIFELRMKDQIEERSSQLPLNLSSCEKKAWKKEKKSGLNRIQTHDLCDVCQLSYQANWKLVILWARNIPVKDE